MTFKDLQSRVQFVVDNLDTIVIDSAMEEKNFIVESNLDQLWDGKTNKGEDIHPYYSEDPFFKSKKAAEGYKNWKQKITPNPNRNPDAPNLFINGRFYKSVVAEVVENAIVPTSTESMGKDIINGHRDIMGLNTEHTAELSKKILPEIQKKLKHELTKS